MMGFGCLILFFMTLGAGIGVLAQTLWPEIPMWPFVLAGFLLTPAVNILDSVLGFFDAVRLRRRDDDARRERWGDPGALGATRITDRGKSHPSDAAAAGSERSDATGSDDRRRSVRTVGPPPEQEQGADGKERYG